jgi:hypothetical protein
MILIIKIFKIEWKKYVEKNPTLLTPAREEFIRDSFSLTDLNNQLKKFNKILHKILDDDEDE